MRLAINMMMYNDEPYLSEVIPQLHRFCDYLVIQDNGSLDGSFQIAKRLSAKGDIIYQYPQSDPPNAAESRNTMLRMVKADDWVLKWDTDELPSLGMIRHLREVIESHPDINAWSVPCYHIMKSVRQCLNIEVGWGHVCLFKKVYESHWEGMVHQQLVSPGPVGTINPKDQGIAIIHLSYFSEKRFKKKAEAYAKREGSGFTDPRQLTDRLNTPTVDLPNYIGYNFKSDWLKMIKEIE